MRVVLRADASVRRGSGHVMRCLALAEGLVAAGHEAIVAGAIEGVPFLDAQLAASGLSVVPLEGGILGAAAIRDLAPDWVVVDSYWIDPDDISALDADVPVLAIVDGDTRGIAATAYLDHNLGADELEWPRPAAMLAGSQFALVRDAVLVQRRTHTQVPPSPAKVVAFMGGTDPDGAIVGVADGIARAGIPLEVTAIAPGQWQDDVRAALGSIGTVIPPTPDLPRILGTADAVVSAAGTSAWDICTLGVPALFIGVAGNQSAGLAQLIGHGAGYGIDLAEGGTTGGIPDLVRSLVGDAAVREGFARRCRELFDGLGKQRVVQELELRLAARLDRS